MSPQRPKPDPVNGTIDWEAAVGAHRRWLRTVAVSRLGSVQLAEEVLQDVAMYAIDRRPHLDDPAKARGWLYRVTVRQTLLVRRRLGREKRRNQGFAETLGNGSSTRQCESNPLAWLLADEERSLVREAIGRLRPRDRELLLLKYTENWTCRDLAEHLGIRVTAVETRLQRARQRLRQELARVDITEHDR